VEQIAIFLLPANDDSCAAIPGHPLAGRLRCSSLSGGTPAHLARQEATVRMPNLKTTVPKLRRVPPLWSSTPTINRRSVL
jgi:hypothetical protein